MDIQVGQIWVYGGDARYEITAVSSTHVALKYLNHTDGIRHNYDNNNHYPVSGMTNGKTRWEQEVGEDMDFAGKGMTKEFFWDNYMNYPDGTRRFVAYRPGLDAGDWSPETPIEEQIPFSTSDGILLDEDDETAEPATDLRIWLPESVDEEFNLVLSLCSDGFHRPVLDLDFPYVETEWRRAGQKLRTYIRHGGSQVEFSIPLPDEGETGILKSSRGHIHVFMGKRYTFQGYQGLLGTVPGEDAAKFAAVTGVIGYGSLRAPWITKPGAPGGGMEQAEIVSQKPSMGLPLAKEAREYLEGLLDG